MKWLERAQIKLRNGVKWPGAWSYDLGVNGPGGLGDNSNTFYALLGLHARRGRSFAGADVGRWPSRDWSGSQRADGGWGYTPDRAATSKSTMTCEGVAGLLLRNSPKREHGTPGRRGVSRLRQAERQSPHPRRPGLVDDEFPGRRQPEWRAAVQVLLSRRAGARGATSGERLLVRTIGFEKERRS